jgi:hypothetical protein
MTETQTPRVFRRVIELTPAEKAARDLRVAKAKLANSVKKKPTKAELKAAKRARKAKARKMRPVAAPALKAFAPWIEYRAGLSRVEFQRTRRWAEVRHEALVKYGAKCQCCGASRLTGAVIHVDHIKPRSKYPHLELELDNLQVLCELCNIGKSNISEHDWRNSGR